MSRSRLLSISAAALVAVLASNTAAHAQTDPVQCQRGVLKAVSKFFKAKTKALQKCEEGKAKGKHTDTCPSPGGLPGSPGRIAADAIAKASQKIAFGVASRCGGGDHTCGTPDDDLNIPFLFGTGDLLTTCPNFENGTCNNSIDHCGDLATCLECIGEKAIDQWLAFLYANLNPTKFGASDPAGAAANKCQLTIGKEVAKYGLVKEKTLAKCWDKRLKGAHGDTCPDATQPPGSIARAAADKIAFAEGKKIAKICRACGGDGACDDPVDIVNPGTPTLPATANGSDIPLADIFATPFSCPDLTVPPAPGRPAVPCARPVNTLADLAFCVDCVAEYKVDCLDASRVGFVATPPECNPAPTPTPAPPECAGFPPAGDDTFASLAVVSVRTFLPPGTDSLFLNGPTVIHRGPPTTPPDNRRKIETEIVSMSLKGSGAGIGPVTLTESATRASTGRIKARIAGSDFLADSYFDIFFVLHTKFAPPMDQLHNEDPVRMAQVIACTPPYGRIYVPAYTLEVPLFDRDGNIVASLTHAQHRVPAPTCGNGMVEPGEDCDDGNLLDCDGCDSTCTTGCGNGILCAPEQCDDANTTPADGCEPDCTLTPPPACVTFPGAGSDSFNSLAVVSMSIPGAGANGSIFLRGPSTVTRGTPVPDFDGKNKIATTIAMTLTGSSIAFDGDVTIRESQSQPSNGQIKAQNVSPDFPADSFFDVFFEIETELMPPYDRLHNAVPVHLQQVISCIPPYGSIYVPAFALTTPLLDQSNTPVGTLTHAQHRVPAPFCGNGMVDSGEACDDGNLLDCDGCDSNCTTGCGNGVTCAPEQCDDANAIPGDGCEPDCNLTPEPCTGETCGNFTGTCNPSFPGQCFCFTPFAGPGGCVDDFQCGTAQSCPGGLGCPAGKVCYVGTCCGGPTCGPSTCTGVLRSVGGGPTAAGND